MTVFVNQDYPLRCKTLQQKLKRVTGYTEPIAIKKSTSNLFRHRKKHKPRLDIRQFNHVLSIDVEAMTVEVEGLITYADLVAATAPYHVLPAVVPELKTITVGGALTGIGIESSSFRYGLVHETIVEFDVLLADGEIVTCHADNEHRDLFFAFPNSYGTFGYALRIVLKVIPSSTYVELNYHHFNEPLACFQKLKTLCLENHASGKIDFIEGIVFNADDLVIATAQFTHATPYLHDYKKRRIYYKSIQNCRQDFLTAEDYIWRWDTDWFWCSKVFGVHNPFVRFLWPKRYLNSKTYRKIMHWAEHNTLIRWCSNAFSKPTESVIQDVAIPIEHAYTFFHFIMQTIPLRPIWMCPTLSYSDQCFTLFNLEPHVLYINFGFWGMIPSDKEPAYYNRLIEQKVIELKGIKSLYSSCYYSEDEFWSIFPKQHYDALKMRYDPQHKLLNLYKKVVTE